MPSHKWNYTLSKKKNLTGYLNMFVPVFFAITATMIVFFAIGWVNWWQALIFALLYLIPLFCLFTVIAIRNPTTYIATDKCICVYKGFEFYTLLYSNIKSVSLKKKRNSYDVLFKLKKGITIHCQLKAIEDYDSAIEVYNFIKGKIER